MQVAAAAAHITVALPELAARVVVEMRERGALKIMALRGQQILVAVAVVHRIQEKMAVLVVPVLLFLS
jgi:hypothetical protein